MSFWERFFEFLENKLPGWLAALALGHKIGSQGKREVENELSDLKVENEKLRNRETARDAHAGKSSDDILRDAIREGGGDRPGDGGQDQ